MLLVKTDRRTYSYGDTVHFHLRLYNESTESRAYAFSTTQRFDIAVWNHDMLVWQWNKGRLFSQVAAMLTIQPGDSRVFSAEWDLRDMEGRRLPTGSYQIHVWMVSNEEKDSISIEVRE
ncbi:hypothetical protein DNHGIG_18460 [Collibacillus ludicampi]|uniref:Intracellular proteinase inhibitor BsuPI domain-containing protein n=1 Tax=Collibacillus ludicampi TaxID=2771369 RepID=A0AAV4LEN4_9BACL|nr:BsuPI-related putative proteinase inhibitor [Collibacillus ludicampi]GIM46297.1 hypothetical protein DNHGIG_18460 [Collibacillus ludicampi]